MQSTDDWSPECFYLLTSTAVLFTKGERPQATGHRCVIGSNFIVIHNKRSTLTAATTMHTQVVWDVTPCRLVISVSEERAASIFRV